MNNYSQKKQISINKNIVLSQIYIVIVCWAIFHVSSVSVLMPNHDMPPVNYPKSCQQKSFNHCRLFINNQSEVDVF